MQPATVPTTTATRYGALQVSPSMPLQGPSQPHRSRCSATQQGRPSAGHPCPTAETLPSATLCQNRTRLVHDSCSHVCQNRSDYSRSVGQQHLPEFLLATGWLCWNPSATLSIPFQKPWPPPYKPLANTSDGPCMPRRPCTGTLRNPAGFYPDATGIQPGARLTATSFERLFNKRCACWESPVHRGNSFRLWHLASHVAYQVARVATRTPFKAWAVNSNNSMYPIIISIAYPELPPSEWTVSLRRS